MKTLHLSWSRDRLPLAWRPFRDSLLRSIDATAILIGVLTLCVFSLHGNARSPTAEDRPPSIVLIAADDLGIFDLGCYGRMEHRTPNLDRLAASSVRFTSAYCGLPICSASRAALMTSKYPARLNVTTYLPGRPDAVTQKLLQPAIEPGLVPSEQTIAEVLQRSGYATGIFGKWHLGGGLSAPSEQGFETVFEPAGEGDPETTGGKNEHLITDRAIEFIRAQEDKPYFCYIPHHSPHILLHESESAIARNSDAWNPLYAAAVESLDQSIGKLLSAIEDSPNANNTIVIFTSDNGGLHVPEGHALPVTHNGPFRAGKGFLYEGGLRVPLIVRWPKRITVPKTIEEPVWLLDVLPTLLAAADLKTDRTVGPVDGQSLLGVLIGDTKPAELRERTFYWHLPHYTNQGSRPSGAIRRGAWKLIEDYESGSAELYNLDRDPGEKGDVAEQNPQVVETLRTALTEWRRATAAQSNSPNPKWDAARHRALYIDQDPSKLDGSATSAQRVADAWSSWRKGMNQAIAGEKPVLKDTEHAVRLMASDSKPHGTKIRYEPETYKNVVGYWTEVDDWVEWELESALDGTAELQIHCGCGSGNGGSEVDVLVHVPGEAEQRLPWTVRETGHFQNIVIESLGKVALHPGKIRLEVRPRKKAAAAVVDIRQIVLLPIDSPKK
ncbi:MAG: sulfatase [Planctomycetota bacterium]